MSHTVLRALLADDGPALTAAAPYDDTVAPAIHAALEQLDVRGRLMATWVLARASGAARANVLLDMTGDPVERVGVAAARTLLELPPSAMPSAHQLVYAIPVRLKPSVRSMLYRAVGSKGDVTVLDLLRSIFDQERDENALRTAHAAAARLGGKEERAALYERIETATPDDVPDVFDELVYVGDASLAPALLPWFDDERIARVIGNHFRRTMIRVVDFAAVATSQLRVPFDHDGPLTLSRSPVSDSFIAAALAAVRGRVATRSAERAAPISPPLGVVLASPPAHLATPSPVVAPMTPLPVPQIAPAPMLRRAAPSIPDPGTAPLPAGGEPMTKLVALPAVAPPSTPFVAPRAAAPRAPSPTRDGVPFQPPATHASPSATPAKPRPRIPTGTVDLENALAAEKAADSARATGTATSSPPPRGPQLSVEQYAWLCALVERRPDQRADAWRRFGIADEATWGQLHAAWQPWLAEDRARLQRFHELVAEYRRAGVSL